MMHNRAILIFIKTGKCITAVRGILGYSSNQLIYTDVIRVNADRGPYQSSVKNSVFN